MHIPTDKEILALHEKHAPSSAAFDLVYTHCLIVCDIAEQLLARNELGIDEDMVRAGCLLHDIGVYRLYDGSGNHGPLNYMRHGVLGYALLAEEGIPEGIRRFASCHTGVGLTAGDVLRYGLPIQVADYVAESEEESLVMYADKFHSKTDPPTFLTAASYTASIRRFGAEKEARFEALRRAFGDPDLAGLSDRYGHAVR